MKRFLICVLLCACMITCLAPQALAVDKTATPEINIPEVYCDPQQKSPAGEYCWEYIFINYQEPNVDYISFYSESAQIAIYAAATGGTPITDGSVRFTPIIIVDNGQNVIDGFNLYSAQAPVAPVTYYLGVTEVGQSESDRVPITVFPFDAVPVLRQRLTTNGPWSDMVKEDDANTSAKALNALVNKVNKYGQDLGLTAGTQGATISHYTPPQYGKNGGFGATLLLNTGDRINEAIGIKANPYNGGKLFELGENAKVDFAFNSADAVGFTKTVTLPVYYTSKLGPTMSTLSGQFFVSSSDSQFVPVAGLTVGIYNRGLQTLALTLEKPSAAMEQTLYLWCRPIQSNPEQCIGAFTVRADFLSQASTAPIFKEPELLDLYPMMLTLDNPESFDDSTVYRVYVKSAAGGYDYKSDSVVIRIGDKLLIGYSVSPLAQPPYTLAITATQPGKAESTMAEVRIAEATEGKLSKALSQVSESTVPEVLAAGQIKDLANGAQGITLQALCADSDEFETLLQTSGKTDRDVVGAYLLELDGAALDGNMTLEFYVGTYYTGQQVMILHKNSSTGAVDSYVVTVDSRGYAAVTVSSLSPFMVTLLGAPADTSVSEADVWYNYRFIEGAASAWNIGNEGKLSFRVDAPYADFAYVSVDGMRLSSESFTVASSSGSTVLRLQKAYLDTLAAGNHTLRLTFSHGSAETGFTLQSRITEVPKTGDRLDDMQCIFGVLTLCFAGTMLLRKRKA